MKKKIEVSDSKITSSSFEGAHLTLVDEVIFRVPTVLLRIVFAYVSRYSEASEIASRWNAASFDGLEALTQELIQKAKNDAFYGKLLIELAYKDQRFQQDYHTINQYPIMSKKELARHFFLQLIFNLVNRVEFPVTFLLCSDKLRTILPNLFSPGFRIIIDIASIEEQLNVIELNANVIKEWLDSKAENSDISNEMIQQVRVVMTPGIMEGLRMVFNLPRERNYSRISTSLLESSFFSEGSREYQLCCRELHLNQFTGPRLSFSKTHCQMLEKMSPSEQWALIRQLMFRRSDQIFNLFSQVRASTSRSSSDDKQPPGTYIEVLKQLSCGVEELVKNLVLEIKRMEQLRERAWELDIPYPGDDATFEENIEFIVPYMSVCNDEASPYKVVVEFLSRLKDPILIFKLLRSIQTQSQEPLMKCVIM